MFIYIFMYFKAKSRYRHLFVFTITSELTTIKHFKYTYFSADSHEVNARKLHTVSHVFSAWKPYCLSRFIAW